MKAVLQLLRIYFAGTTLSWRVSGVSALLLLVTLASRVIDPEIGWMLQTGYMPDASPAFNFFIGATPVLAVFGLFFGTFMLPVVLGQLSAARRLHALPYGRVKVIVSGFVCIALVSLALTAIFTVYIPQEFRDNDFKMFSGALVGYTLLYVVLWFVTQSRTVFGKLTSCMLLIALLAIPAVIGARTGVLERLAFTLALWAAIAFWVGRFKQSRGFLDALRSRLLRPRLGNERRGIDALVGTANPWLLALGQLFPFAIAMLFVQTPSGWLFYLALFAALTGAVASLAARRSRALWLRARWSRDEIFTQLERAFWRQNGYALAALALAHAAICAYFSLSLRTLALGLPLLVLAAAMSTYLGFMMTRRIGWVEIPLALAGMFVVMATAVSIPDEATASAWIVTSELALFAAALWFRLLARDRWHRIDWALAGAAPEHG